MEKTYSGRAKGGLAASKVVKQKHINKYLENPNICEFCRKQILPKEGERAKDVRKKRFCNTSCATSYNNEKRLAAGWVSPNRNPKNYCLVCGISIKNSKSNLCQKHRGEKAVIMRGELTKGELTNYNYSSSNKYELIRQNAKDMMDLRNVERKCSACGYDKHVEVCHVKPIADFPDTAFVKEINSPENIVYLCPNHHWELDNSLLECVA